MLRKSNGAIRISGIQFINWEFLMFGTVFYGLGGVQPQYYCYPQVILVPLANQIAPYAPLNSVVLVGTQQEKKPSEAKNIDRREEKRQERTGYTRRKRKGNPKKKSQNPERNVLTNISSQLMSYLLSKRKSSEILDKLKPNRSREWQQRFYLTLKKLKIKFSGYYNADKIRELWFGTDSDEPDLQFHRILRIMSQKYIQNKLVNSLLTSKKLSDGLRKSHFRLRRELLRLIRNQDEPSLQIPDQA